MAKPVAKVLYYWQGAIACNAARKNTYQLKMVIADGVYKPWRGHCSTARRARTRAWQKRQANQTERAYLKRQLRNDLVVD
jgi:hypothetical protein